MHSDQRKAQLLELLPQPEQYSANEFCHRFGVSAAKASLTRKKIAKSDRVVTVGDSGKMGASAVMTGCSWTDVGIFISDTIEEADRNTIAKNAVEIITVK